MPPSDPAGERSRAPGCRIGPGRDRRSRADQERTQRPSGGRLRASRRRAWPGEPGPEKGKLAAVRFARLSSGSARVDLILCYYRCSFACRYRRLVNVATSLQPAGLVRWRAALRLVKTRSGPLPCLHGQEWAAWSSRRPQRLGDGKKVGYRARAGETQR